MSLDKLVAPKAQAAQKIWYVAQQRLCNFHCSYCVSTGEGWEKSNTFSWTSESERATTLKIIEWIGTRDFPISLRLGTLGEPFATAEFLRSLSWLTRQPNINFVETLTNGALLERRLATMAHETDFSKLSLWITYHSTEIDVERLVRQASFAQKQGAFVVVNALYFPGNESQIGTLRLLCDKASLRFNLDLGYDASGEAGTYQSAPEVVEVSSDDDWLEKAIALGAREDVLATTVRALNAPVGLACGAGSDYVFIGVEGDMYPCSRYYELGLLKLGNVLDENFTFNAQAHRWRACRALAGCSNKEDYLNLQIAPVSGTAPSLGWVGASPLKGA